MSLPEHQEEQIVVGMFDRGLLGFPRDGITLKSGRKSPYYYNARHSLSFDKSLDQNGIMSVEKQREFRRALIVGCSAMFLSISTPIDHVFGKAQSATAPSAVSAYEAGISYIWERVDEPHKIYGNHQKIEGNYEQGDSVLIADDVTTDGMSKAEGSKVLTAVGLNPVSITLQFDREEGGVQILENEYGFEVNAVTSLSKSVRFLLENHRINNAVVETLQKYHNELRADGTASTFGI